jgi:hypothetical protein
VISGARDVSAVFTLERAFGQLREAYVEQVLEGTQPSPAFWEEAEERAYALVRDTHFSRDVRAFIDPEDRRSDEQAWEEREGVPAEEAAVWTHRRIIEIPFVGDGAHDDPDENVASIPAETLPGDETPGAEESG